MAPKSTNIIKGYATKKLKKKTEVEQSYKLCYYVYNMVLSKSDSWQGSEYS